MIVAKMVGRVTVTNMAFELFNDALYYREQADQTDNQFLRWRYLRSAVMCFCASTEAWVNALMVENLKNLQQKTPKEQIIYNFLTIPNNEMPKKFVSIKERLKRYLPGTFQINSIDNNAKIDRYIELSNTRNMLMHYAYKDHEQVYKTHLEQMAQDAPDIIQELFDEYHRLGNSQPTPAWYYCRQSRCV